MTYDERQAEIERLRTEHAAALSAPRIMDGAISSTQINRMGKRQYEKWQSDVQTGFDVRAQIKDLSRTDEQIAQSEMKAISEANRQKRESVERYIAMVESLGPMSHLKNGKLKKGYQIAVDAQLAILASLTP